MQAITDTALQEQVSILHHKLNPDQQNPNNFVSVWASMIKRLSGVEIQANNFSNIVLNRDPLIFTYIVKSDATFALDIDVDALKISQEVSGAELGAIAMMLSYVMTENDQSLEFSFMQTQLTQFYNHLRQDEKIGETIQKMWNYNNNMTPAENVEEEAPIDIGAFMNPKLK